jgi:hypothetical protein
MNSEKTENFERFAYCGLFCEACGLYIATKENPDYLKLLAERMNKTVEEVRCKGCRSDTLSYYCQTCTLKSCARSKGFNFCSECSEYPCNDLKEFQVKMPHRAELFQSLDYLKNNSVEMWEKKMRDDYSCPNCGAINAPYYVKCAKCGTFPGNKFIERNLPAIKKHLNI